MDLKTETHDGDIYHFGSYFFTVLAKFKSIQSGIRRMRERCEQSESPS